MAGILHLGKRTTGKLAIVAAAALTSAAAFAVIAPPSQAAASCSAGYVALTFDDGPGSSTSALLDVLQKAGVRATLFNIGQNVQSNLPIAQQQAKVNMWIGNHSFTHGHMAQMNSSQMTSELSRTQDAVKQATGTTPKIFRPPYGETNSTLQQAAAKLGLTQVTWDVDSRDWAGAATAQIVQAASTLRAGGIILMHDGYQTTRSAIPQIVNDLKTRNLCAGTISPTTGRAVAPDSLTTPPPPPISVD